MESSKLVEVSDHPDAVIKSVPQPMIPVLLTDPDHLLALLVAQAQLFVSSRSSILSSILSPIALLATNVTVYR